MKLLLCENCWDVFKLKLGEMRTCECGRVKGQYVNNIEAEVSENAVSLAIGNGSLQDSIQMMRRARDQKLDREQYIEVGKIRYAWVRPNEGPGNPHCTVIKD